MWSEKKRGTGGKSQKRNTGKQAGKKKKDAGGNAEARKRRGQSRRQLKKGKTVSHWGRGRQSQPAEKRETTKRGKKKTAQGKSNRAIGWQGKGAKGNRAKRDGQNQGEKNANCKGGAGKKKKKFTWPRTKKKNARSLFPTRPGWAGAGGTQMKLSDGQGREKNAALKLKKKGGLLKIPGKKRGTTKSPANAWDELKRQIT